MEFMVLSLVLLAVSLTAAFIFIYVDKITPMIISFAVFIIAFCMAVPSLSSFGSGLARMRQIRTDIASHERIGYPSSRCINIDIVQLQEQRKTEGFFSGIPKEVDSFQLLPEEETKTTNR